MSSSIASIVQFGFGLGATIGLAVEFGFSSAGIPNPWRFTGPTNIPRRKTLPTLAKLRSSEAGLVQIRSTPAKLEI